MSGGSYDYVSHHFDNFADSLRGTESDPRRAALQKLLRLISKAAHDIEWVDSCDYGVGAEYQAIDEVFAFLGSSPEVIKKAHSFDALREMLQEYFK